MKNLFGMMAGVLLGVVIWSGIFLVPNFDNGSQFFAVIILVFGPAITGLALISFLRSETFMVLTSFLIPAVGWNIVSVYSFNNGKMSSSLVLIWLAYTVAGALICFGAGKIGLLLLKSNQA